jgi:hypothetical protein
MPILSLVALLLAAAAPGPDAAALDDITRAYLRDRMHFTAGDLQELDAGRAVARQMATRDPVDVNIFGAVRIDAPPDAFLRQLQAIDTFERKLGIIEVGKFGEPPRLADLDGLTLDRTDARDLERCRPGDCQVQLPAAVMTRFVREVDWRAPNAKDQADRLFRAVMFERLQAYRGGGLPALGAYHDSGKPISVADDFRLLSAPGDLPVEMPELAQALRTYPNGMPAGATDFFYWNKGEFGMKPTTRLNHVIVYPATPAAAAQGIRSVVATSQVYANHYFSATLELRTVVDDPAQPGRRFYLFYTTKSRVSGLTGFIGLLIRGKVRSRARSGMEKYLANTKRIVESAGRGQ